MVFTFLGRSKERVLEIKEFNVLLNLNEISDSREVKKHKKIDLKKKSTNLHMDKKTQQIKKESCL